MPSIRSTIVSASHKVALAAQIVANTVQPVQAEAVREGDDRFDKHLPQTEVMATPPTTTTGAVGDGKTISWLEAISGVTPADSAQRVVRQELTALSAVRIVDNGDSTLTITNVPEQLRVAENLRVMAGWDKGAVAVVTEGRREINHTGAKAPAAMVVDKDLLARTGELRVALPMASADERAPDVVTLTVYRDNGDGYLLPLSAKTTHTKDSLDVPDPLGAIAMGAKRNPTFSLDSLRVSDVQQGAVGSCYFLASTAGLITRDQSLSERVFAVDDNRMWVQFQQPGMPTRSTWVLSDADQNQGVQARRVPRETIADGVIKRDTLDVMWPVVLEKAWMTMSRSHDYRQENGGPPDAALRGLGVETIVYDPGVQTDSTVLARITAGDVYVAATKQRFPADRVNALSARGIVASHAYTVLGADVSKGEVMLYNPWGFKKTVTVAEFREAFATYYEKKPPLPAHIAAAEALRTKNSG